MDENGENLGERSFKVVLPGEVGYVRKGEGILATFAVGADSGCRGYLVASGEMAGLAHVDFPELDREVIERMVKKMKNKDEEIVFGATSNAGKEIVSFVSTLGVGKILDLPSPEYGYDLRSKKIIDKIPDRIKKDALEKGKSDLITRLKSRQRRLLER